MAVLAILCEIGLQKMFSCLKLNFVVSFLYFACSSKGSSKSAWLVSTSNDGFDKTVWFHRLF